MENILEVSQLTKNFHIQSSFFREKKILKAVSDVSFKIEKGTTFGLVGESGSGKTTVGKCILGLYDDIEGEIFYGGQNLIEGYQQKPALRQIQVVFQDPYSSLNPMMTIGELIAEPLQMKTQLSSYEIKEKTAELLERVQLEAAYTTRYPHELSGGQRQRVGIARALSTNPDLIILDEPISALDVSIQSKIVKLLKQLQQESGVSYLFIAHDLEMVRYISQDIGVMFHGQIVEYGKAEAVYNNPQHPYTQHLLQSILKPDPQAKSLLKKRPIFKDKERENLNKKSQKKRWKRVSEEHFVMEW